MYLSEVQAEGFRTFGSQGRPGEPGGPLRLVLTRGLNVLVGENDSGKTAAVDAIRLCLSTTSGEHHRITRDDFHCANGTRADEFTIMCVFRDLTEDEHASFLELLTKDPDGGFTLYVVLRAQIEDPLKPSRVSTTIRTGKTGSGPALDGGARERLRVTYLKPLRDAEAELRPGRNSRLSQILASYPGIAEQDIDDFDPGTDQAKSLVGILRRADHHLGHNTSVKQARDDINENYLSKFGIGDEELHGEIGVSTDPTLQRALERLELRLSDGASVAEWTRRGLGYHNALFMAAELLLLSNDDRVATLLIEEPEAHLHPQLQARVMELLVEKTAGDEPAAQVILTTHSPNIASTMPVECLTTVCRGRTFSLAAEHTKLDGSDYAFLSRFLDVTKANMFFARSVALVEGDSEVLLLPALAQAMGRSFSRSGVGIVNVGHIGQFRYSRIFQRADGGAPEMPVKVACIRDRDLVPNETDDAMKKGLRRASELDPQQLLDHLAGLRAGDGGPVKSFISDVWTLEFDLAAASWKMAKLMRAATAAAVASKKCWPDDKSLATMAQDAATEVSAWQADGKSLTAAALEIYRPLRLKRGRKPDAAQHAARLLASTTVQPQELPKYLVKAIDFLCGAP